MPPKPNMLTRIVGCGCSPVVSYEGTGSYFLDKLENGLWRLEVYPDAVWVDDPYGIHRLDREVSRVLWRNWPMEINLPDLGQTFTVEPIDKGNNFNTEMTNGAFMIYPGVYLLRREDANSSTWRASTPFGHLLLGEFVAPPELHKVPIIVHKPPYQIVAGRDWLVTAQVVSSTFPKAVALYMRRAGEKQFNRYNMNRCKGYEYNTKIPGDSLERGLIEYSLSIEYDQTVQSFPAKVAARPGDWDFPETTLWHALVVNHDAPIVLFDAERDRHKVLFPHPWGTAPYNKAFVPGVRGSNLALRVDITQLASDTEEFVWRSTFVTEIESRHIDINYCNTLSITARAGTEATTQFSIALIDKDGTGWGTSIPVATHWQEIRIPLSILQPTKVAVLPRGWPRFSKWLEGTTNASSRLTLSDIEGLQISLTSKFPRGMKSLPHALEIQSVMLERVPEGKRSDIKTVLTIP
jgi:hypothetical protein